MVGSGLSKLLITILVTFFVSKAGAQSCLDLLSDSLARNNPTAAKPLEQYTQPNTRDLPEYNDITGAPRGLENEVPLGGLAIDVGGGQGKAYHQLAEKQNLTAIVINTQELSKADFLMNKLKGKFVYRRGWAQRILREYEGQADLITDIWGAFSYEMDKAEILNLIYAALKPGGTAYILFNSFKTPAIVKDGKNEIDIDAWLAAKFPSLFSWHASPGKNTAMANILVIKKPLDGSGPENIGLVMTSGIISHGRARGRAGANILPKSEFAPIP